MRQYIPRLYTFVGAITFLNVLCLVFLLPKFTMKTRPRESILNTHSTAIEELAPTNARRKHAALSKPCCPHLSNYLVGTIKVDLEWAEKNYWTESNYEPSKWQAYLGEYETIPGEDVHLLNSENILHTPRYCRTSLRVAFIIPFRAREPHLKKLVGHLTPILRRQLETYSIFVVEQHGNRTFNKGRLMNTGFEFANMIGDQLGGKFDCFVFHDVDLLPERDDLLYRCTEGSFVDHLAPSIDKFDYKPLCCGMTVGGVLAFKSDQFRKVNGFPNSYWGWGGEDDDMNIRIRKQALKIARPDPKIGRFTMIKHRRDQSNPRNIKALQELKKSWVISENDGLVNLDTEIKEFHLYPLFTKIFVDVKVPPDI